MSVETIEARLDRLESIDAIRQLAAKYSLSLDMRDMDAHVNLFAPDIRVGKEKVGRAHFKAWQADTLRDQFTGTSHHLGQHIIESRGKGHLRNGKVIPIDERFVNHWNFDPWRLDSHANGYELCDGASFLLPYWLGVYHGFIKETDLSPK